MAMSFRTSKLVVRTSARAFCIKVYSFWLSYEPLFDGNMADDNMTDDNMIDGNMG
jgi:hypothetical protein